MNIPIFFCQILVLHPTKTLQSNLTYCLIKIKHCLFKHPRVRQWKIYFLKWSFTKSPILIFLPSGLYELSLPSKAELLVSVLTLHWPLGLASTHWPWRKDGETCHCTVRNSAMWRGHYQPRRDWFSKYLSHPWWQNVGK